MKRILFISFILLASISIKAQIIRTLYGDSAISGDNIFYHPAFVINPENKSYDTVKVFLLYSLKSSYSQTSSCIGYKVLKFIRAGMIVNDGIYPDHWEFEAYLDDRKKPIGKNILVWQTQPF